MNRNILLGTGEASRRLGIYPDTLVRWANNGRLPYMRDSAGRRLFRASDIEVLKTTLHKSDLATDEVE